MAVSSRLPPCSMSTPVTAATMPGRSAPSAVTATCGTPRTLGDHRPAPHPMPSAQTAGGVPTSRSCEAVWPRTVSAMDVGVRRVRADEWATLRRVRLAALLDAPTAFSSTHEMEAERADDDWIEWAGRA